jgi:AraC family transcriptional regulator, ethanolamine operon transcriptional activator
LGDAERIRLPRIGWKQRNKYARQARDFIESHLGESIRLEAICQAVGVSARTLEYSFREIFQAGPLQYLEFRRLNAVRGELLKANRQPTTVTQIAMNYGFGHLVTLAGITRRSLARVRPKHTAVLAI